jgi:transcriptional regulator with XRE-family HTH domain
MRSSFALSKVYFAVAGSAIEPAGKVSFAARYADMQAGRMQESSTVMLEEQDRVSDDRSADAPSVGKVLRRAREHQRLSLREVERRTGRASAYLSQVERGVIRQPDPLVLMELARLYHLDFLTLASWAGWARGADAQSEHGDTATTLVRRVLELNPDQRAELLGYVEQLLRQQRS